MALQQSMTVLSFVAGADLSAKQYTLVKLDTDGTLIASTASTDFSIGVLQNKPQAGETAAVSVAGLSKVIAYDDIIPGQPIKNAGAPGQVISAATPVDGDVVIGIATTTATSDELVEFIHATYTQVVPV